MTGPAPLTFVVGTGRCGSTLLSQMLHQHPDVLSMSEFFSIVQAAAGRLPVAEMDGERLWELLSTMDPYLDGQLRAGLIPPEMCYPLGRGRYSPATGVPLVCYNVLPLLSEDPDRLFDQLGQEVRGWPPRPAAAQYRALFGYLAGVLGRRVVVERSGASVTLVPLLRELFPDARFVHMHREGPDCALSMSRHPTFRRRALLIGAAQAAGLPPATPAETIEAALSEKVKGLIAPPFDAGKLMSHPIPVSYFARYWWSGMISAGATALSALPRRDWLSLRFEDLAREPVAELTRLAGFLGVPAAPGWLRQAAAMVNPARCGSAAAELSAAELESVRAACVPGVQALDRLAGNVSGPATGLST